MKALAFLILLSSIAHADPTLKAGNVIASGTIKQQTTQTVFSVAASGMQSSGSTIMLLQSCSNTQTLVWNSGSSTWGCGAGGITNSAGAHVVPVSDGTDLGAGSMSDDAAGHVGILGGTTESLSLCASGNCNPGGGATAMFQVNLDPAAPWFTTVIDTQSTFRVTHHDTIQNVMNVSNSQGYEVFLQGTMDTSAGDSNGWGFEVDANATNAGGGHVYTNNAILANASGGDINYFLLSNHGDFRMNPANSASLGATTTSSIATVGAADFSAATSIELGSNITSNINTIPGTSSVTPQLSIGLATTNDGTEFQTKNTNSAQADSGALMELDTTVNAGARGGYLITRGSGGGGGLASGFPAGMIMCSGNGYSSGCAANDLFIQNQTSGGDIDLGTSTGGTYPVNVNINHTTGNVTVNTALDVVGLVGSNTQLHVGAKGIRIDGLIIPNGTAMTGTDISSCGTGSPAMATGSTDQSGSLTEGTTATGCTIALKQTHAAAPFCTCTAVTSGGSPVLCGVVPSTSALVFTTASATGDVVAWTCLGPS